MLDFPLVRYLFGVLLMIAARTLCGVSNWRGRCLLLGLLGAFRGAAGRVACLL